MLREAVVAGTFYPDDVNKLNEYCKQNIGKNEAKYNAKAIIVPHAGYVYSGSVAASAYKLIKPSKNYIIIGPNHTGLGAPISIFDGVYNMPFGDVKANSDLIEMIVKNSDAKRDYYAHMQEHSIEVQLPFIKYISNDYSIVPIVIGTMDKKSISVLGLAIGNAINAINESALIVVSSDFNHYEDQNTTIIKDKKAIDKILEFDEEGLFDVAKKDNISMCGIACTYAALVASKECGAKNAILLRHATSGDINKDYNQVVGYASIVIE